MNLNEIENLLLKYRNGQCSPEEQQRIHAWYDQVRSSMPQSDLTEEEKSLLKSRMWTAIQHNRRAQAPAHRLLSRSTVRLYASAAAVALLTFGLFYFFGKKTSSDPVAKKALFVETSPEGVISSENTSTRPMRISLGDSSQVTLAPGARLVYPRRFLAGKREVQLEGDAFFQITKDSRRPFFVYSGKLVTRVLGTSFWVKEGGEQHQMQVEVVCGKVSVFENERIETSEPVVLGKHQFNKGVILTPNQRVTYFEESGHLMTSLVDEPLLLTPPVEQHAAIYKNVALPDIFNRLEAAYGVDIVVSGEAVNRCTFTGDLSGMALFEQLDLICQSNDGSYQVQGTRILVSAAGCI
ncbi:iron dicitrate transporter FecR [Dyadobacter beijingensis]|uniref:Iron dicitrate transporter FecR n=1 Tax=Dyadobacter beijingensis TaxID=365489 RepID=A0ABQ2I390_9BACT|nr:FecR family protein [Dyadobacter beijingensis]GGM96400.1 iron dicitrate transporter FecR [Dyadobacter beijingensis]